MQGESVSRGREEAAKAAQAGTGAAAPSSRSAPRAAPAPGGESMDTIESASEYASHTGERARPGPSAAPGSGQFGASGSTPLVIATRVAIGQDGHQAPAAGSGATLTHSSKNLRPLQMTRALRASARPVSAAAALARRPPRLPSDPAPASAGRESRPATAAAPLVATRSTPGESDGDGEAAMDRPTSAPAAALAVRQRLVHHPAGPDAWPTPAMDSQLPEGWLRDALRAAAIGHREAELRALVHAPPRPGDVVLCHVSRRRPGIFRRKTEYYLELERGRVKFMVALSAADESSESTGGGDGSGAAFDARLALAGIGHLDGHCSSDGSSETPASAHGLAVPALPPSLFQRPVTALGIPGLPLPGQGFFSGGFLTGSPSSSRRSGRFENAPSPPSGSRLLPVGPMKAIASARRRVSPRMAPRRRIELMLGGSADGPQCGLVIGNAGEGAFRAFDTAHSAVTFQKLAAAGFIGSAFVGRGAFDGESGRVATAPSIGPAAAVNGATSFAARSSDDASTDHGGLRSSCAARASEFPQPLEVSVRRSAPDGSGPRKLDVLAPPSGPGGWSVATEQASTRLCNVEPRWNDSLNAYCLNFRGRVTQASVKNFQLEDSAGSPGRVVMQFGRVSRDGFSLDFAHPLTAFQAFSICLACLEARPVLD